MTRLEGFPGREELAQRYADMSGRSVPDLGWYEALALWKSAVFCEAIYGRYLRGERGTTIPSDARSNAVSLRCSRPRRRSPADQGVPGAAVRPTAYQMLRRRHRPHEPIRKPLLAADKSPAWARSTHASSPAGRPAGAASAPADSSPASWLDDERPEATRPTSSGSTCSPCASRRRRGRPRRSRTMIGSPTPARPPHAGDRSRTGALATFGLVHGAPGTASGAGAPRARARGADTRPSRWRPPADDPHAGLERYADETAAALIDREDVVLVGHSLAGHVVPLVPFRRPVRQFVFSVRDRAALRLLRYDLYEREDVFVLGAGHTAVRDEDGASYWPDPEAAKRLLFHDCTAEDADRAARQLRPQPPRPRTQPFPLAGRPERRADADPGSRRAGRLAGLVTPRGPLAPRRRAGEIPGGTRRSWRGRPSSPACSSASPERRPAVRSRPRPSA